MSPRPLVVIGGGEHARVLVEAARSRPDLWNVVGFVDPRPCVETARRLSLSWLGDEAKGLELARAQGDAMFVIGVGSIGVNPLRRAIAARYDGAGARARWAVVVHRDATVSPTAGLAGGTVVFARGAVNTGALLGAHCVVNTGAVVEHDVRLGDFTQLGPAGAIGGGASVGEGSYLGLGCRVRDHVSIGREVMVGMGAVVARDVPDRVTVFGVPARRLPQSVEEGR